MDTVLWKRRRKKRCGRRKDHEYLLGRILSAVPYFRGRNVLAPSETETYDPDSINDIATESRLENEKVFSWTCDTVGNQFTLHPSTSAVLVKVQGDVNTKLHFQINQKNYTASIGELLEYGYTCHMEYYHSQALKIHRALPETRS